METFKKRQKEVRRLERQREKAARRLQRKQNPPSRTDDGSPDEAAEALSNGQPGIEQTTDQPAT
jgi:hypothetical protein